MLNPVLSLKHFVNVLNKIDFVGRCHRKCRIKPKGDETSSGRSRPSPMVLTIFSNVPKYTSTFFVMFLNSFAFTGIVIVFSAFFLKMSCHMYHDTVTTPIYNLWLKYLVTTNKLVRGTLVNRVENKKIRSYTLVNSENNKSLLQQISIINRPQQSGGQWAETINALSTHRCSGPAAGALFGTGASPAEIGILVAAYSMSNLLASHIFGRLADVHGGFSWFWDLSYPP